jgi:hypothetical protein
MNTPDLGEGSPSPTVPTPSADARPAIRTTQSRVGPGGHPNTPAGIDGEAVPAGAGRTYLSGPISLNGTLSVAETTRNIRRFRVVREALEARGVVVVDPTQLRPPEPKPTWLDWMRTDLKALLDCDRVLLLPGWEESRGACVERRLAEDLGILVEEYAAVLV